MLVTSNSTTPRNFRNALVVRTRRGRVNISQTVRRAVETTLAVYGNFNIAELIENISNVSGGVVVLTPAQVRVRLIHWTRWFNLTRAGDYYVMPKGVAHV